MKNEVIRSNDTDPFTEFANETVTWRLLKFVDGRYLLGGSEEVPLGRQYVALIPDIRRGWTKFVGGRLVDQKIGRLADGFKLQPRDTLGDIEKTAWETDGDGNFRDPWAAQIYLPLEDLESGELVVFVTGSKGGHRAVGSVCSVYGRAPDGGLPIIEIGESSYLHKLYRRKIPEPKFTVVGRTGETTASISSPSPAQKPALAHAQRTQDDELPPWGREPEPPLPTDDHRWPDNDGAVR